MPDSSAAETKRRRPIETRHNPAIHVGALLVVASPISTTAITAMQAEVHRIWDRYGVRIRWLAHGLLAPDSRANVDVLLADSREGGRIRPTGRDTLGASASPATATPGRSSRSSRSTRRAGRRAGRPYLRAPLSQGLARTFTRHAAWSGARPRDRPLPARTGAQSDGLMRAGIDPRDVLAGEPKAVSLTAHRSSGSRHGGLSSARGYGNCGR